MKKLLIILIILFALLALFSAYMIFKETKQRNDDIMVFEELSEKFRQQTENKDVPVSAFDEPQQDLAEDESVESIEETVEISLDPLIEMNPDCVAWITVAGTSIDYPVMHTPQFPDKYLTRNFYGQYSPSGVPYLDEPCTYDSTNLVIHGHNMTNGTMFADLKKFTDAAFFANAPRIELITTEGKSEYAVFAVVKIMHDDPIYSFFDTDSEQEFDTFIDDVANRAMLLSDIQPNFSEQLITLSTCNNRRGDERLVVIGVKAE